MGIAALGALLGWLAGSVLRVRRAHVEEAMRAAGIAAPARAARAMYGSLGRSLVELLALALGLSRLLSRVAIEPASRARWDAALAQGRGVVVAASHTGNWDLAACAMAQRGELLVVTKHLRIGWLDRLWQGARAARGVRLVPATGAVARAREVLGRGGAVAMMIDQVPSRASHAVPVTFLGRPALADRAPAALAAAARCPLVVAASRRLPGGRHELLVLDVLSPPPRASRRWIEQATAAATRALDGFVREHPSQWLWLHRRWKLMLAGEPARPAGPARPSQEPCKTPSSSPDAASTAA